MVRGRDIITYAQNCQTFTCHDIMDYMSKHGKMTTANSLTSMLSSYTKRGLLMKSSRGVYTLQGVNKTIHSPYYNEEMSTLHSMIKESFPFITFCIWNINELKRLSHHVANLDVIYIDVESIALESVFNMLNCNPVQGRQVYYRPNMDEYERYIIGKPTIIVRKLTSQSPLSYTLQGEKSASIEKILVDSAVDKDFYGFQGSQIIEIYQRAYELYRIEENKLMRYAVRKNRKQEIQTILKEISLNRSL